jgi:uncharacterized membrane protein YhaH (DUF805 family)
MDRLKAAFDVRGRASRLDFWRYQVVQALAGAIIVCLAVPATVVGGWLGAIPLLLVGPVLVAAVCISIRRLHDRNRPSWWVAPVMFGPFVLAGVAQLFGDSQEIGPTCGRLFFMLASLGMWAWGWVEIGFRRGTKGPNRFGPETIA